MGTLYTGKEDESHYYWQRELEIEELTSTYEETSFTSALIAGLGAGWVVGTCIFTWLL